jgi:hypothetical protein
MVQDLQSFGKYIGHSVEWQQTHERETEVSEQYAVMTF